MWDDIYYDLERQGGIECRRLPVAVCVLAKFSGSRSDHRHLREQRLVTVTPQNFDDVMCALAPIIEAKVDCLLNNEPLPARVSLCFRRFEDLEPANAVRQIGFVREALERRDDLSNLLAVCSPELEGCLGELTGLASGDRWEAPDRVAILSAMSGGALWANEREAECLASLVEAFIEEVSQGTICRGQPFAPQLAARVQELGERIAAQAQAVAALEEYERLRQTWTGLRRLVTEACCTGPATIRILDVSAPELCRDLYRLDDGKSEAARLICESELESFGGEPFNVILLDHLFSRHMQDLDILENMGRLAETCSAVLIAGVAVDFFGVRDLRALSPSADIDRLLASQWFARWRRLRAAEFARWVVLAFPDFRGPGQPVTGGWRVASTLASYLAGAPRPESDGSGRFWWPADVRESAAHWGFCLPDLSAQEAAVFAEGPAPLPALHSLLLGRIAHHVSALVRQKAETIPSAADWQAYLRSWLGSIVLALRNSIAGDLKVNVDVRPKTRGMGALDLTIAISFDATPPLKISRTISSYRLMATATDPEP
jgi:type VI secretion system ImpB/VipA family protein